MGDIWDVINEIDGFDETIGLMNEKEVGRSLELITRLMENPDVAPQKASPLIVECQALSAKFAVQATYYTTLAKGRAGTENNYKKQYYYTLSEQMYRLSIALKALQKG